MNRNRKTYRKALLSGLLLLAGLGPSMPAQGASCDLYCPGGDGWTTKPVGWDTNVDLTDDGIVSVADFARIWAKRRNGRETTTLSCTSMCWATQRQPKIWIFTERTQSCCRKFRRVLSNRRMKSG